MKIAFTGDVHLHEWPEFSRILPDGTNSRLRDGANMLTQVIDAAFGGTFVLAGDLFQAREELTHGVLDAAAKCIAHASETCKEVILLVGNHDQHLKHGNLHSLEQFRRVPRVKVVDRPTVMQVGGKDGFKTILMPYIHDYDEWLEEWNKLRTGKGSDATLAIVHADIIGAQMDGGFLADKGISAAVFDGMTCIAGHYHRPQQVWTNVHYVGSPYHITRNDAGDEKRYLMFNESRELESHLLTGYPRFKKVTFKEREKLKESEDFVDIVCTSEELKEAWKHDLTGMNPVLESVGGGMENFTASKPSLAIREWLERRGRLDLLDRAMGRIS